MGRFDVPGSAPNGAHGAPLFNSVGFQKISLIRSGTAGGSYFFINIQ